MFCREKILNLPIAFVADLPISVLMLLFVQPSWKFQPLGCHLRSTPEPQRAPLSILFSSRSRLHTEFSTSRIRIFPSEIVNTILLELGPSKRRKKEDCWGKLTKSNGDSSRTFCPYKAEINESWFIIFEAYMNKTLFRGSSSGSSGDWRVQFRKCTWSRFPISLDGSSSILLTFPDITITVSNEFLWEFLWKNYRLHNRTVQKFFADIPMTNARTHPFSLPNFQSTALLTLVYHGGSIAMLKKFSPFRIFQKILGNLWLFSLFRGLNGSGLFFKLRLAQGKPNLLASSSVHTSPILWQTHFNFSILLDREPLEGWEASRNCSLTAHGTR